MYNASFYPTPANVASKMLARVSTDLLLSGRLVLEPSAGKADLAEAVNRARCVQYGYHSRDFRHTVHCIELDPELQAAVRGNGFPLVGTDFLTFWPDEKYSLIVMNPPFAEAGKHLLHAWEILENGEIVCIVNEQTVTHPHTAARKELAALIEAHGETEPLGACFADAFRKTDVRVSLIHLSKKAEPLQFEFMANGMEQGGMERDGRTAFTDGHFAGEVATRDIVGNMVMAYDKCRSLFLDLAKTTQEIGHYAHVLGLGKEWQKTGTDELAAEAVKRLVKGDPTRDEQEVAYNAFVGGLKRNAWREVFRLAQVDSLMSRGVREEFERIRETQTDMAFSENNIFALVDMLFENRGAILQRCVMEAFDHLTEYHHDNRLAVEGWKTNDAWRVNERFILPRVVDADWGWRVSYRSSEMLQDIDRAMAYLEGKKLEEVGVTICAALEKTFTEYGKGSSGMLVVSDYFEMRPYKKGTCHFRFRDRKLWERFNLVAASGKNWLPDDVKAREKEDRTRNKRADRWGLLMAV